MTHLPKIGNENILFDSKGILYSQLDLKSQSSEVLFDKTLKGYVMKVGPSNTYTYHNSQDLNIKGSKIFIQVFLIEKLKFICELSNNEEFYRILISPTIQQPYIKKVDEVKISSAFILTNKWISLTFDVESFFKVADLQLRMLSIHSQCRLKKMYEGNQGTINDGQCLVQRICEKRILELLPQSLRAQSEKQEMRKPQILSQQQRRQSTISNSQERNLQTDKKSMQLKPNNVVLQQQQIKNSTPGIKPKSSTLVQKKLIHHQPSKSKQQKQEIPVNQMQISSNRSKQISANSHVLKKQMSQECLLEKTIKLATGLQVIEEVNLNKPPIHQKVHSNQKAQTQLQKKAVQSFLRHTQEFQNGSHFSHEPLDEAKTDHDYGHKQSQNNSCAKELYYDCENSEYQTKYGKFSSTFSRPLGLSSYNHRLVSQQSTNQQQGSTNEYFYLSSQQIEQQKESLSQTANEIEEQIEAPEIKSKMTEDSFNSINGLQIQQEDSSEDLAVSKFE